MSDGSYFDARLNGAQQFDSRSGMLLFGRRWPSTREEVLSEYSRRWEEYLGLAYRWDDFKRLNLFEARESNNVTIIAQARRIVQDLQFVANVDAAAIATDALALGVRRELFDLTSDAGIMQHEAMRLRGSEVWRRSAVAKNVSRWALHTCALGDLYLEVVRGAVGGVGSVIIAHDPRKVTVTYDAYGIDIVKAVIVTEYFEPAPIDPQTGRASGAAMRHLHVRVLTPDTIETYIDGVRQEGTSGANPLGVVPIVRLTFRDAPGDASISLNACYGYGDAAAQIDSAYTQLQVLVTRHANPILKVMGATLANGSDAGSPAGSGAADVNQVGRAVELPKDTDLQWLEASLQGIRTALDLADHLVAQMRQTLPEFLFVESGASSSGTALSYRAGAFVAKIEPIRQAWYAGLARATAYGVAYDTSTSFGDLSDVYEVDGGEALPMDVAATAKVYADLAAAGYMTKVDVVRRLQGLGLVDDDIDPDAYVLLVDEEAAMREASTLARVGAISDAVRAVDAAGHRSPDDTTTE